MTTGVLGAAPASRASTVSSPTTTTTTTTTMGTIGTQQEEVSSTVVEHLRNAIRQAMKDPETAEIVELLCDNNGWTLEDFLQTPHKFTTMELFLLSTPQLREIRLFPYLTVVKIIHVGLESMESFSHLHHVEELWLNENNIRVIEGLQHMHHLKKLFLQGNLIESMEGIPHLPHLQRMWICGNRLRRITGLNLLPKLKSLWVASNRIASLQDSFTSSTIRLEELNLANNQIYFLGQLTHLTTLKSLRTLWLSDPMYGSAPVCRLNNYTTFSLCHLSQLEQLDGVDITSDQRTLALSVYAKKCIYYSMRSAILDRNIAVLTDKIKQESESRRNTARQALRQLDIELMKLKEYELQKTLVNEKEIKDEEKTLIFKLQRARETREVELERIERYLLDAYQRTMLESDGFHERLILELNSCGNIRIEEGTDNDSWCTNAKELLSTRFDANLYENMGITGVKVNRVFRIMCQGIRERFDSRMRELDIDLADTRNRRALVRLFSPIPQHLQTQRNFLHEVMINGFTDLYPEDEGVPLTNSLFYADQERLSVLNNNNKSRCDMFGHTLPPDSLSGQVIVSRLFLGKCVAEMGGGRDPAASGDQPFIKSDRRNIIRRHYGEEVFSIYRTSPHDTSVKVWHMFDKYLLLPEYVIDFTYITKTHLSISPALSVYDDLAALQTLLKKTIPECSQDALHDTLTVGYPMFAFLNWLNSNAFYLFAIEETTNVVQRAKELYHPKEDTIDVNGPLDDQIIENYKKDVKCPENELISYCNFSNRKITSISEILNSSIWSSLKILYLQNNNISSLSWESLAKASPLLETLDLGNNEIREIELGSSNFTALRKLCLSFNQFHKLEDLLQFREKIPLLEDFQMDHNPWMVLKDAEIYCFAVIPQLRYLNGVSISRNAYLTFLRKRTIQLDQASLQHIISEEHKRHYQASISRYLSIGDDESHINSSSGNNNSNSSSNNNINNNNNNNKSTSLKNGDVVRIRFFEQVFAELAEQSSGDCVFPLPAKRGSTFSLLKSARVFCFRLSLTQSLSFVSLLPQLRHLNLSSHLIEDITPLAELRHLRTLNVSDNLIKSAKPLGGIRLISLDISRNQLSGTEGLENLSELRFLSIGQNSITNVSTLQGCNSLEELYFADNLISEVRELYPLRNFTRLVSIDAVGNPCAGSGSTEQRQEYRNYIIYNLPKLKVLDGVPITESEQQMAKELFSGRVNSEMLAERVGASSQWGSVHEVDLSQCGLREVIMLEAFSRLQVLHLHHNCLAHLDGLLKLQNLVALNLSHNRLGQYAVGNALKHLENLRSLSLESNHITDLSVLSLTLPRLKFLNLKGNEIVSIDQGLQGLTDLRELLLDNNKLRSLGPDCFANNLQLTDISAEENYIRSTEGLQPLVRLEMLGLGSNRLSDLRALLNDLRNACCLVKVTFIGNAIARKTPYRAQTIAALPALTMLDHKEVTVEERDKAELLRAAELATPHNVVLDPAFSVDAVAGLRVNGAAGATVRALNQQQQQQQQQQSRFPVNIQPRAQLPAYKNARSVAQLRDTVNGKGFIPRLQGSR